MQRRLIGFGIGAVLGAAVMWLVRRYVMQANGQGETDVAAKVAPMTAPVVAAPSHSGANANGSAAEAKPISIKTNIVTNRPAARPEPSPEPAQPEPTAAAETAPAAQTTRADSDADVTTPAAKVEAPTEVAPVAVADAPAESIEAAPTADAETEPKTEGDDFDIIFGIGEFFKHKLYAAGITTFQQLADASSDVLDEKVGLPAWRVARDEIREQAAQLARGETLSHVREVEHAHDDTPASES